MIVLCLVGFVAQGEDRAAKSISAEEFKAAFLSKLPPYVRWPEKSFGDPHAFTIGVWGDEPTERTLDRLAGGTIFRERTIRVRPITSDSQISGCQLLFVSHTAQTNWQTFMATNKAFGILTVGENQEFINQGGDFALQMPERKLVINRVHAAQAGLKINSKLLQIAIVEP